MRRSAINREADVGMCLPQVLKQVDELDIAHNRIRIDSLLCLLNEASSAPASTLKCKTFVWNGNVTTASMVFGGKGRVEEGDERSDHSVTDDEGSSEASEGQRVAGGDDCAWSSAALHAALDTLVFGHGGSEEEQDGACGCVICVCAADLRAIWPKPTALELFEEELQGQRYRGNGDNVSEEAQEGGIRDEEEEDVREWIALH
jgi:hypothetical protein